MFLAHLLLLVPLVHAVSFPLTKHAVHVESKDLFPKRQARRGTAGTAGIISGTLRVRGSEPSDTTSRLSFTSTSSQSLGGPGSAAATNTVTASGTCAPLQWSTAYKWGRVTAGSRRGEQQRTRNVG